MTERHAQGLYDPAFEKDSCGFGLIANLDDMNGLKVWVPEGDRLAYGAAKALGISPVSMPLTDVLTGLLNRRAIETRFGELRAQGFTTMAVIDLDHFKEVNDVHGHQVGDRVLRTVGDLLAGRLREVDTLGRWGGEEFVGRPVIAIINTWSDLNTCHGNLNESADSVKRVRDERLAGPGLHLDVEIVVRASA